jgi:type IV pilus assembly protein PilA
MQNKRKFNSRNCGFTLLELLIAIVIVGIISAIAIPSYLNYTRKAYYTEIVKATAPFKIGVVECFHTTGQFIGCNEGMDGIPNKIVNTGAIGILSVKDGVISVVPNEQNGIKKEDTYILTPDIKQGMLIWQSSGGGISKGYTK